jgi:TolB-like protein/Tfp pilus assembly protein PilF
MTSFWAELKRRNVVRVAVAYAVTAWLLLQLGDVVLSNIAAPPWVIQVIMLLLVICMPVALIFAWAFELTPEGLKKEGHVDPSVSITQHTGRKLDFTIIAALTAALALSLYLNFNANDAPDTTKEVGDSDISPSIAVLPFANRSANDADAFFVDGMHDDLLTHLAKISALKVISRTSVMQYRDTLKTMRVIGDELDVSTLLEGGVQRSGDRIRINVQLIDAKTGGHLWAETYNQRLTTDNIFEIQEQIASEVAVALNTVLSPDDKNRLADRPTDNIEAYEAYVIGRQKLATRITDEVQIAVEHFQRAMQLDSEFVLAYVGLAESYFILYGQSELPKQDMFRLIRPLVSKAHDLDDRVGEVYNVMGALAEYDLDISGAEAYYRKSIELSPGYATARWWLGLLLFYHTGRLEEGAEIMQRAVSIDPRSAPIRTVYGYVLGKIGRTDEAFQQLLISMDIDPTFPQAYYGVGGLLMSAKHDYVAAMHWNQKAGSLEPNFLGVPAEVFLALGDLQAAREWIQPIRTLIPNDPHAVGLLIKLESALGHHDEVAKLAEEAMQFTRDISPIESPLYFSRNGLILDGQPEQAYEKYIDTFPELASDKPTVHANNVEAAVDLVLVLQEIGKIGDASRLIDAALSYVDKAPHSAFLSSDMLLAELHAMNGDSKSALASLHKAVESDWLGYWWDLPDQNPNLALIHGDPEYIALMDENKANLAAQLDEIHDLQLRGKLAAQPDQVSQIEFDLSLK